MGGGLLLLWLLLCSDSKLRPTVSAQAWGECLYSLISTGALTAFMKRSRKARTSVTKDGAWTAETSAKKAKNGHDISAGLQYRIEQVRAHRSAANACENQRKLPQDLRDRLD